MRHRTVIFVLLDTAIWALVAFATFLSGSDPATKGLDAAAGIAVTALFALTAVPAFALTRLGRAQRTALALAIAFPGVFAILFVAAIVAWSV